ncbi:MAG: cellulose biosynthesis cyclic di-GMP-binding regulatory protein BcsB [Pseudomonadota bacterium]
MNLSLRRWMFAALAALVLALAANPGEARAQTQDDGGYLTRDLVFDRDLRHEGDLVLSGVWAFADISFGIPGYWELAEDPELHIKIQRSALLLEDISSITVRLNGAPVATIPLQGLPDQDQEAIIRLPLDPTAGYHRLDFQGYHRSHLPCELTNHPGLWSRVLESSFIRVRYRQVPPELNLAHWPYPIRDDRDPDQNLVTFVLPADPDADDLLAAAYLASSLGHAVTWRPMDLRVWQGAIEEAPRGNLVVLTRWDRPDEHLARVRATLAAAESGELRGIGQALNAGKVPGAGLQLLLPRADDPRYAVYCLLGKDGGGLVDLATLMSNREGSTLPVGLSEWVDEVAPFERLAPRDWEHTVPPEESFTLEDLGLHDMMATGARGGTVTIPLNLVPDDHPIPGRARIDLVYSTTAQASTDQSRVDVLLNGVAAGGAALPAIDGRNRAHLLLDLPVHEMGPASRLEVAFRLVGLEQDECLGEWIEPMWGTVHSDTSITLPRERWAQINDLSLLRYGGYPFALRADMSDMVELLPPDPGPDELQLALWLAAELGRVARGDRFAYQLRLGVGDQDSLHDKYLVVVDSGPQAELLRKAGLLGAMSFSRERAGLVRVAVAGGAVALGADPAVAYFESFALPWSADRAALVAYAMDASLFERVGPCLHQTPLFDRLGGRLTRVASCDDLAAVAAAQAHLAGEKPVRVSAYEPIRKHYWWILLILVVGAGAVLVVRALWIAPRRRPLS